MSTPPVSHTTLPYTASVRKLVKLCDAYFGDLASTLVSHTAALRSILTHRDQLTSLLRRHTPLFIIKPPNDDDDDEGRTERLGLRRPFTFDPSGGNARRRSEDPSKTEEERHNVEGEPITSSVTAAPAKLGPPTLPTKDGVRSPSSRGPTASATARSSCSRTLITALCDVDAALLVALQPTTGVLSLLCGQMDVDLNEILTSLFRLGDRIEGIKADMLELAYSARRLMSAPPPPPPPHTTCGSAWTAAAVGVARTVASKESTTFVGDCCFHDAVVHAVSHVAVDIARRCTELLERIRSMPKRLMPAAASSNVILLGLDHPSAAAEGAAAAVFTEWTTFILQGAFFPLRDNPPPPPPSSFLASRPEGGQRRDGKGANDGDGDEVTTTERQPEGHTTWRGKIGTDSDVAGIPGWLRALATSSA